MLFKKYGAKSNEIQLGLHYGDNPSKLNPFLTKKGDYYRIVNTLAERNAIPAAERSFGMRVVVIFDPIPANNGKYILANLNLGGTNNNVLDNTNFITDGGGGFIPSGTALEYIKGDGTYGNFASTVAAISWSPGGNTFASEQYIGTNANFALPFRVNGIEVARFNDDAAGSTRFYFNANTNLHGSNAGIQYSSDGTSPNRSQARFNLYGANTGAPGITGFKSRGVGIGSLASVLPGDNLFRLTTIGVSGNNSSINLASLMDIRVNQVFAGHVSTDFVVALNSNAGVMTERLYVNSEGNVGIGTSTPIARLQVDGPVGGTTILGPVLDNLGGWTHLATVSGGNGFLFLESGGSSNVIPQHRVQITGGDGGHVNVYDLTGLRKVELNGAVGSNHLIVQNDAHTGALEVQAAGNVIAYQNLGVGIALPTSKLHVRGLTNYAGTPIVNIQNLANTAYTTVNDDGNIYISSNQYTGVQWQVNGAMVTQIITTGADIAKQRLPGEYTFTRKNDDFILGGKSGVNWFFQAANNTAISPSAKVHIQAEGNTSAEYGLKVLSLAGTSLLQVRADGFINTSIPTSNTGLPPGGTVSGDLWHDLVDNTVKRVP